MPRTFVCQPNTVIFGLGASHKWTVEESSLSAQYISLLCPFHEEPRSYSDGPYQGEMMLLAERLERSQRA